MAKHIIGKMYYMLDVYNTYINLRSIDIHYKELSNTKSVNLLSIKSTNL